MAYFGTQPNDVKKNTGLYTPSEILQLTKDGQLGWLALELIQDTDFLLQVVYQLFLQQIYQFRINMMFMMVHFKNFDNVLQVVVMNLSN